MSESTRLPSFTAAELAVLSSGVASMGLEILAGRIIAPEFGSSIYTWGSIIGVFLTALGVGYWLGGKRAPERASDAAIVKILTESALFVAFVLFAGDAVLQATDALPLPPRFAPLVPITVLFGAPVFLLGFISPYAAELSMTESTGSAAGRVYALGTIGSIVGSFATTFFLIPAFDVAVIQLGFGALLLATAAAVAPGMGRQEWLHVGIAAVVLLAAFSAHASGLTAPGDTVYRTGTAYSELRVTDDDGVRTMYLDGAPQSAMYLDGSDEYVFDYARAFHLPFLYEDDIDRVLFIGGGGFSGPKRFVSEYENVTVDVVEIDPEVVGAAEKYFGVEESDRLRIHTTDGREFLQETNHTYDLIVLDAYRQDQVPFHMTTAEFFDLASRNLDEDGVFVANLVSAKSGSGSAFFRAEYKTLQQVFPQVYAFPTSDTNFLQNIEVVATKDGEFVSKRELLERNRERRARVGLDLRPEIERYRSAENVNTRDVPVLRDDKAPVDRLLDPQLGRRYVIEKGGNATEAPASRAAPASGVSA